MQTDYVQRFLFEHLDIRGRLVCLTGAWRRMLEGRGYPEHISRLLGHTTALAVLLGAFAAHFLIADRGYVLVNFRGLVLEMSVPGLVIVLVLAYVLVRALVAVRRKPDAS